MDLSTPQGKYEFELWVGGVQVGDITKIAKDRKYSLRRNASESLDFSMDITAFERYCALQGSSTNILTPYVTDILVKRNGVYKFGTQMVDSPMEFGEDNSKIEVKATGFLDLFKDRYITKDYSGYERVNIFRDAIVETQGGDPLDDWGVEFGVQQYNTPITDTERICVDQNVRDLLVGLTGLSDGTFDFKFNYDRSVETFENVGSIKPEQAFTYPGNIKSLTATRTAMNLFNYVIGLGSGFGEETLRTETADAISRALYGTRQIIQSFNGVTVQQTLDENTYAFLQKIKELLVLPKLKVVGAFADLDVIDVGDIIPINMNRPMLTLEGNHRIEQIDVSLDDNDFEDIDVTVDDYGL